MRREGFVFIETGCYWSGLGRSSPLKYRDGLFLPEEASRDCSQDSRRQPI
jgi:hypothetical protein